MTRDEMKALARESYRPGVWGHGINSISKQLGLPHTTVRRWVVPGYDEKLKKQNAERKRTRYSGTCDTCGGRTGYSGVGSLPSRTCTTCARQREHDQRHWTAENVIDAIQRFNDIHGRPPKASEWESNDPVNGYPSTSAVHRGSGWDGAAFGTWNEAIAAAGFTPTPRGHYERTPEIRARMSAAQQARWARERTVT